MASAVAKIPGNHHVDIIFIRADLCHQGRIGGGKRLIQIERHEHSDAKPNRVRMGGMYPGLDFFIELRKMDPKYLRTEQITGGPIIDMGQKSIHGRDCLAIILHLADQKTVEIVFLIVGMQEAAAKRQVASGVPESSFANFRSAGVRTPITVSGQMVGISLL